MLQRESNMAEPTEKSEKVSAFEPTDRIETFLIGSIAFLQNFLLTLRDLVFNQTCLSAAMKDSLSEALYQTDHLPRRSPELCK